jgi:hypothetical protein
VNPILEEMAKDPMLTPTETLELDRDAYVPNEQFELNQKYIYDAKYRKEKGIEVDKSI